MIKKFIKYYKPYVAMEVFDLIAATLVALINLLMPMFTRYILNQLIPEGNLKMILILASGILAFYLAKAGLNYYMACQGHIMASLMQADMRADLFIKLEKLPCSFFDNHKTGELMSRVTSDLFDVSELAHHGPEDLLISVIQLVGAFAILGSISPLLTLICCVILIPMAFLVKTVRTKLTNASRKSRAEIAELNAGLENSISGVRVTKAFSAKNLEEDRFQIRNEAYVRARRLFCEAMGTFTSGMGFGTDMVSLLVVTIGAILVIQTQNLNSIDLVTFMLYISVFTAPITRMVGFMEQYENGMTGFARFQEIMDEKEETDEEDAIPAPSFDGNISFQDVHFSYSDSMEVLHGITLEAKAGSTIALVGSSGGGKTTICHLLPRFYELDSGSITIDGTDIRKFTRDSLRSQIGIVAQDVFLFNATIAENIAYGTPTATREQVIAAAKLAKLDEFVSTLPDGYDTSVGERGTKLSGGQKQRIAIARVFLKNPSILILDEATSALDNVTESQIQSSLKELSVGRTTIVVAHRLSTVRGANRILYIEDGKIKEEGTHEELVSLGGEYAKLIAAADGIIAE